MGYKLPKPLVGCREGGSEAEAQSQDIGLTALVMVPFSGANFSVKRRMRPALSVSAEGDLLNAFILRFVRG